MKKLLVILLLFSLSGCSLKNEKVRCSLKEKKEAGSSHFNLEFNKYAKYLILGYGSPFTDSVDRMVGVGDRVGKRIQKIELGNKKIKYEKYQRILKILKKGPEDEVLKIVKDWFTYCKPYSCKKNNNKNKFSMEWFDNEKVRISNEGIYWHYKLTILLYDHHNKTIDEKDLIFESLVVDRLTGYAATNTIYTQYYFLPPYSPDFRVKDKKNISYEGSCSKYKKKF